MSVEIGMKISTHKGEDKSIRLERDRVQVCVKFDAKSRLAMKEGVFKDVSDDTPLSKTNTFINILQKPLVIEM
jgi:hypothetical protein